MKNIYFYTRYERGWHWLQMLIIFILLATGFEIHGLYTLFGFQTAVKVHNVAGITWLTTFSFFVFWIFTTGEWKQYIPTTRKMFSVIRYYAYGIFHGEAHPVPKRRDAKHNPLQRITYLSIAAFLLPFQMGSGVLYWTYNSWTASGFDFLSLSVVAFLHTACAFAILQFLIVHVYMTTTGHTIFAHLKAMITGWEKVDDEVKIEDWERAE
ncbi:MAG: cytochrome b/b6 domain-containing protein [Desulfobacterales bacterium]